MKKPNCPFTPGNELLAGREGPYEALTPEKVRAYMWGTASLLHLEELNI